MSVSERQVEEVSILHEQLRVAKQRGDEFVRADQALRKIVRVLTGDGDLSSVVGKALVTASEQLEAPVVEYWIHESNTVARLVLSCRDGRVYDGSDVPNDPRVSGITIPPSMTGADSLFKLRGHFVADLATDPEQRAVFDPLGFDLGAWCLARDVTTHLNVQLRFGDRSLGSLVAYFRSARVLTDARIELAYALANQIALAIRLMELGENAKQAALAEERALQADHRAREASRISNFLGRTLGQMSEAADLQLTIESIISGLAQEIGAVHVFLFRHDAATRLIRLELSCMDGRIRRGLSGEELPLWATPFPDDITPAWRIMVESRGLFTPNMSPIPPEEFGWPGAFDYIQRFELSDVGHIVLFAGSEPVGSIGFGLSDGRLLKSSDKQFIEEVAKQAALAIRILDLAEQAKRTAVEKTQRRVAQERAAELVKANTALRACMAELMCLREADQFLATFLKQAVAASGALAGAVLRRLQGTEFEFVYISRDGEILTAEKAVTPGVGRELRTASSLDPTGHFAKLAAGRAGWRHREDKLSVHLPMITQYHREIGTGMLYDFPFGSDSDVTGYLGLAFQGDDAPSQVVQELLTALSTQVGLALELTRLYQADKATAIALERERAAQERADELVKANTALRLGIEQVIENRTIESLIDTFLDESRKAVHAQGAAVMLRVDGTGTTFRPVAVCEDGVLSRPRIVADSYFGSELEALSGRDPMGILAALARGETPSTRVADLEDAMPTTYQYHRRFGHSTIWHAPLLLRETVLGYIALAFREDRLPSAAARETVMALAQQLVLALELSRLAKASEESAVRREREVASQERAAELAKANHALRSVNAKLTSELDLQQFLGFVLAEAASSPKAETGAVFLLDGSGCLIPAQWWEAGQASDRLSGYPYPAERPIRACDWTLWQDLCSERAARVMKADDFYGEALEWHTSRSHARVVVAPLLLGNDPLGFLGLAYASDAEISETTLQLISALAEQTTLAVRLTQLASTAQIEAVAREAEKVVAAERSRQEEEQKRLAAERLQELMHANAAMRRCLDGIGSAEDLDHLQSVVLRAFIDVFEASTGSLWSFDQSDGSVTLELEAFGGESPARTQPDLAHTRKHFLLPSHPQLYEQQRRLMAGDTLTLDTETSDMFGLNEREHLRQSGVVTHIVIPLSAAGRHLGRLALGFTEARRFSPAESEIASTLAIQASLVVEMTRLADTSRRLAVSREQERATTEERSRLAREIHDTLAQSFSGIIVQLRAMRRASGGAEDAVVRQMHADHALELASTGLAEARRSLASLRLRELEGRSLREALTLMAESTMKRSGIPVRIEAANELDFGSENEPELLRIAQESVTNAVKHSGASQIVIALRREGSRYDLCVEDNGRGFDLERTTEGFGLIGMQERAKRIGATMSIETSAAGTAVCVHLERGDADAA